MVHYRPQGADGPQVRLFFRTKREGDVRRRQLLGDIQQDGRASMASLTPAEVREFREAANLIRGVQA